MNLTGRWKGWFKHGGMYPKEVIGEKYFFEFLIEDNHGSFSGTCKDEITEQVENNESFIVGTYQNRHIVFKKRYKIETLMMEDGTFSPLPNNYDLDGIDYYGYLSKSIFSRTIRFRGRWKISITARNSSDEKFEYVCDGTWMMEKLD